MKIIHVILCSALFAVPALADTGSKTKLSTDEQATIAHEHAVNQMEIMLGQMAQKQSTTQAVKDFGKDLVSDHQKADSDLTAFAKKHDAVIGKDVAKTAGDKQDQADMQKTVSALKTMKGSAFDKQFLDMMVTGHEHELTKLDTFITQTTDGDLKTLLSDVKPVMQKHEDSAKTLQTATPRS